MTDLADWLLAQIADDEQVANAVTASGWREALSLDEPGWNEFDETEWEHIVRHDPARVLAECAAKRAIVGLAREIHDIVDSERGCGGGCRGCEIQRLLAQPYADRPDFDEEWRV